MANPMSPRARRLGRHAMRSALSRSSRLGRLKCEPSLGDIAAQWPLVLSSPGSRRPPAWSDRGRWLWRADPSSSLSWGPADRCRHSCRPSLRSSRRTTLRVGCRNPRPSEAGSRRLWPPPCRSRAWPPAPKRAGPESEGRSGRPRRQESSLLLLQDADDLLLAEPALLHRPSLLVDGPELQIEGVPRGKVNPVLNPFRGPDLLPAREDPLARSGSIALARCGGISQQWPWPRVLLTLRRCRGRSMHLKFASSHMWNASWS